MLLIDKPKDYTSARVVDIIKRKLGVKKAGHSGTLDPKATGLMIVCMEKETKRLSELLDYDKEYEGVMVIGATTRTFDTESEVKVMGAHTPAAPLSEGHRLLRRVLPGKGGSELEEKIHKVAESFRGEIEQVPPMHSAVKFKGRPLYKYARKNQEVSRSPRKVLIRKFEIEDISFPEIRFRVSCSKGTYIRTLVNDFGERLGTGAYLKELRRTKIGEFHIKDAVKLEDL
jgi:tRNA pseudouridine55 synthase